MLTVACLSCVKDDKSSKVLKVDFSKVIDHLPKVFGGFLSGHSISPYYPEDNVSEFGHKKLSASFRGHGERPFSSTEVYPLRHPRRRIRRSERNVGDWNDSRIVILFMPIL